MLERLLRLVAEGGLTTYTDLVERTGVSQAWLEAMLEDLVRMGYLRAVTAGCERSCGACPVGVCSVTGPGRLLTLTAKGSAAATRSSPPVK